MCSTPRPVSSSGVKTILMFGRGASGMVGQAGQASMISAMPALLSAPSRVFPDGGDDGLADFFQQIGVVGGFQDDVLARRQHQVLALVIAMKLGSTPAPETSGEVSMWAIKAMVGTYAVGWSSGPPGRIPRDDLDVLQAQRVELGLELDGQVLLLGGRREGFGISLDWVSMRT